MGVSSFHRYFKQMTYIATVQFQKRVRLQEARRRLFNLTSSDDAAALRALVQVDINR